MSASATAGAHPPPPRPLSARAWTHQSLTLPYASYGSKRNWSWHATDPGGLWIVPTVHLASGES